jgi:hypothetical protein
MIPRGVNVDVTSPANCPADVRWFKQHGFDAVRLVNKSPLAEQYAATCKQAGVFVLDAITNEAKGQLLANADLHEIRNEIDIASPSSEGVIAPGDYQQQVIDYAGSNPGLKFTLGSLAAGDYSASYLRSILPVLQDPNLSNVIGFSIHPYGKSLADTKTLIATHQQACRDVLGRELQVFVTEWNRPAAEIPGYDWWLRQNTGGAWWFCYGDGGVPGFGLVDAQGKPKPELGAFHPIPKPPTPKPGVRIPAPPITYKLLDASHYDYSGVPREGLKIAGACNHIADGYGSLYGWFASQQLSTNYWIARDGRIECYVRDEHAAYGQGLISLGSEVPPDFVRACGGTVTSVSQGYLANCLYLSIEHEGHPQDGLTPAQLARSRWLNRWLAQEHNYPFTAEHVVGHWQFDHINRARCGRMVPQILGAPGNGAA